MKPTETIISGLPKFVAPLNLAQLSPPFIKAASLRYQNARIGRNVCFRQNIPELISWGAFLLGDRTAFIFPLVALSAPAGLEGVLRPTSTRPFRFPGCRIHLCEQFEVMTTKSTAFSLGNLVAPLSAAKDGAVGLVPLGF